MFVKHSVHIETPIEAISAAFATGPRKWFPRLDSQGRTAVGPSVAGIGIQKKVVVEVGEPLTAGSWTQVPITWRATYIERLFPVMSGNAELAPVDVHVTRLTVCGMYQPPLGRLGKQFDDALLHKVAEATVKELAESIARRIEAAVADELVGAD